MKLHLSSLRQCKRNTAFTGAHEFSMGNIKMTNEEFLRRFCFYFH